MSRSEGSSWRTRGDSLEAFELVLQSLPVNCRQNPKNTKNTKNTKNNVDTHLFLPIEKVRVHVFITGALIDRSLYCAGITRFFGLTS
jgi:hypothetical protein